MTTHLLRLLAAALASLALGCLSNPTPHPGQPGGDVIAETSLPPAADPKALCERFGGDWDPRQAICITGEYTFEDAMGAPPAAHVPPRADVLAVEVFGGDGVYTFVVTIRSDDASCDAWTDWWEIVDFRGHLVHRELLAGPATSEQPFTSSGGPVAVAADEPLVIRAHFHPEGYGGDGLIGTVEEGFIPARIDPGFASRLATARPQPEGCDP